MICIAPRARRLAVGFLGFVLPLYTFDVQAAPIHIAKKLVNSSFRYSDFCSSSNLHHTSASKRSISSLSCIGAWIEIDQLPQTTTPCFNLGSRRSRQPPRQEPGRHGPIAILRATLCGPLSINLSWKKCMFCVTDLAVCNFDLQASGLSRRAARVAEQDWIASWSQHDSPVALMIVVSISTIHCLLRQRFSIS
jgi:hypothetical protein